MTTGEKLTKLRKEHGYTQEELADILDVSRQSISKWESDTAFPETAKLIKLGQLYHCSMDYLLKESEENPDNSTASTAPQEETQSEKKTRSFTFHFSLPDLYFERKSKIMVGKLPLWHINIGLGRTATGIFAIGLAARGIVSVGLFSLGIISFGVLSLGLFAFGALALGLLIATGAISAGIIACGAISFGLVAFGAVAIGDFSFGALAVGKYFAVGDHAKALIAIGRTKAVGSVYSASKFTELVKKDVAILLYQEVPKVFHWIVDIIESFLSPNYGIPSGELVYPNPESKLHTMMFHCWQR